MNRGHVLQSSPYVQQIMASGSPNNWWSINNMRPSSQPTPSSFLAPPPPLPPNLFPQFIIPPPPPPSSSPSLPLSSSWNDTQELPESWSQLLLGGLVGEEHILQQNQTGSIEGHIAPATTFISIGSTNNMLDFSSKNDARHPPPSHSSECNSTATGGVAKKARVEPSSSTQSTFKVRKEKLGDRITALHQIVSPFGKTDTASVLLEAIGYIRFLHNQIEALSIPYLGNGSGNMRQQQHVQADRSCLFPEDPGQLLNNDGCNKKKGTSDEESDEEAKKDLRSRGLCLVPISCTMQVESDNGADYWAPPAFNGGFR